MLAPANLHCDSNKLFSAEVIGLTGSIVGGRHHYVKMNVRFHNLTDHPIILAYVTGTSSGVDNLGNAYYYGRPHTHDGSTSGIGCSKAARQIRSFSLIRASRAMRRSGSFATKRRASQSETHSPTT